MSRSSGTTLRRANDRGPGRFVPLRNTNDGVPNPFLYQLQPSARVPSSLFAKLLSSHLSPSTMSQTPAEQQITDVPWSSYMLSIYRSKKPPPLGTVNMEEIEQQAREKLKDRRGTHGPHRRGRVVY